MGQRSSHQLDDNAPLLQKVCQTREELVAEYMRFHHEKPTAGDLRLFVLNELENSISCCDDDDDVEMDVSHLNDLISHKNRDESSDDFRNDDRKTLLHYATLKNKVGVVQYLLKHGLDVNAKDMTGLTPLHIAVERGNKDVVAELLNNGAFFNIADNQNRTPVDMTKKEEIINLFAVTDKFFKSVRENKRNEIEKFIKKSPFVVNARNVEFGTVLHYTVKKRFDGVARILLTNNANPNLTDSQGRTPLHYACESSNIKIAKALLSNGACYEITSNDGKTPADLITDKNLNRLFNLISESFEQVKTNDSLFIGKLNNDRNDVVRAVMGAKNNDNEILTVAALRENYTHVMALEQIGQEDLFPQIENSLKFTKEGKYQKALSCCQMVLHRRIELLGPSNPATLEFQVAMSDIMYRMGRYKETTKLLEEVFEKQKEILGANSAFTLQTRSRMGLMLCEQGKHEEALIVYQKVFNKQKAILGPDHPDTLATQFHLADVYDLLHGSEEALLVYHDVLQRRKRVLGTHHIDTVSTQNNIAKVLCTQGKYDEALTIFNEVFERKKAILGLHHGDTARTLQNIGIIYSAQKLYDKAIETLQEALKIQKSLLGAHHPEFLQVKYNMANCLQEQGKFESALKIYREVLEPMKSVFAPNNPMITDCIRRIQMCDYALLDLGVDPEASFRIDKRCLKQAAIDGDLAAIREFIEKKFDLNQTDADGKTPLHHAAVNGRENALELLLSKGAQLSEVTKKGNTALHMAVLAGHLNIVELLLKQAANDGLDDFIDAKTTVSGSTALHVAAKCGSLPMIKLLLKHGASYDMKNKDGKTPVDMAISEEIGDYLKSIDAMFKGVYAGDMKYAEKLRALSTDESTVVLGTRNSKGKALVQVGLDGVENAYKMRCSR